MSLEQMVSLYEGQSNETCPLEIIQLFTVFLRLSPEGQRLAAQKVEELTA